MARLQDDPQIREQLQALQQQLDRERREKARMARKLQEKDAFVQKHAQEAEAAKAEVARVAARSHVMAQPLAQLPDHWEDMKVEEEGVPKFVVLPLPGRCLVRIVGSNYGFGRVRMSE
jgi:predicted nuclease with TOPRIM domain